MIHEIATDAGPFEDITAGRKSYIMQKDTDAQYQVGDFLALNETVDEPTADGAVVAWTGRCCLVEVVHISHGPECYLQPGTIVMSFHPCAILTSTQYNGSNVHKPSVYTAPKDGVSE